jgi:hypothetical protein
MTWELSVAVALGGLALVVLACVLGAARRRTQYSVRLSASRRRLAPGREDSRSPTRRSCGRRPAYGRRIARAGTVGLINNPQRMGLSPGTRIGSYEIVALVGDGGMGAV